MSIGGGSLVASVLGTVVSSLVNSMFSKGKSSAQPMLVEQPPTAATGDSTKSAAEGASIQQDKRTVGASGRDDTIQSPQLGGLYAGDTGSDQQKTLLGY